MWRESSTRRRVLEGVTAGATVSLTSNAVGRSESTDEGGLLVRIRETSVPVQAGDRLAVTAAFKNRGGERTTVDARLIVGHDPERVDGETVAIEPGSTETVTVGYETARVERTQQFPVRIEAGAGADERRVTVFGIGERAITSVRPASSELTVQPGTPVLFEVSAGEGFEPGDVEWTADEEIADDPVLAWEYTYETGNGTFIASAETPGTYDVRATVPTGTGTTTLRWTMRVRPDGRGQPAVEDLVTEPSADEVVSVEDDVEITVSARDTEGTLDRVLWIEGQNHTVADVDALTGPRRSATLAATAPPWLSSGYPTMARVVCEDGRMSDLAIDDGPDVRPPFAVEIVETSAPVDGGDRLEVTAAVENTGSVMMVGERTQEIDLIVGRDPERVDSTTVTVTAGTTETVILGYKPNPVRWDDEVPIRVESADDADERTVTVRGTHG